MLAVNKDLGECRIQAINRQISILIFITNQHSIHSQTHHIHQKISSTSSWTPSPLKRMSSTNYTIINDHFNGLHFHKKFHTDNCHVMYIQHQYLHHNIQKEVSESWIWRPSIANINAHYQITAGMLFWCNINHSHHHYCHCQFIDSNWVNFNVNLFDQKHCLHKYLEISSIKRLFWCLDVNILQP